MADTTSTSFGGLDNNLVPDLGSTNYKDSRWKSTEHGDFPPVKIRPTSATNAFMVLRDPLSPIVKDKTNAIRLWVHEITLGWSMNYQHAQTAFGRSFYPRHIQYANAVVRGQTASQQHYDEIVDMVLNYQSSSIVPGTKENPKGSFDIIRFEMPAVGYHMSKSGQYGSWQKGDAGDDKTYYRYDRVYFDGHPLKISAGHKKGIFNPEFEITFLVAAYKGDNLAIGSSFSSEKALLATLNIPDAAKPDKVQGAIAESGYQNYNPPPGGTSGNQG
jgi:hypothetical protein